MNEDLHALSGAHAVDALPDLEGVLFERHLARCGACDREVRRLRETAARLALTAATLPPSALRRRVLEAALAVRPAARNQAQGLRPAAQDEAQGVRPAAWDEVQGERPTAWNEATIDHRRPVTQDDSTVVHRRPTSHDESTVVHRWPITQNDATVWDPRHPATRPGPDDEQAPEDPGTLADGTVPGITPTAGPGRPEAGRPGALPGITPASGVGGPGVLRGRGGSGTAPASGIGATGSTPAAGPGRSEVGRPPAGRSRAGRRGPVPGVGLTGTPPGSGMPGTPPGSRMPGTPPGTPPGSGASRTPPGGEPGTSPGGVSRTQHGGVTGSMSAAGMPGTLPGAGVPGVETPGGGTPGGGRGAGVVPLRRRWRGKAAVGMVAVATAAASVFGVVAFQGQRELADVRAGERNLVALDRARQDELADARDDRERLLGAQRELLDVMAAADVRIVRQPITAGGAGTIVISRQRGRMVFASTGLPGLDDEHDYELWLMSPEGTRSAGLLERSGDRMLLAVPEDGDTRVALTVEPAGGSRRPTTTPIMLAELPAA